MTKNIIKRYILNDIRNHLSQKEFTLIIGPRQAGKTTLMLLLMAELEKSDKKTLFFNLDIETDRQFFSSQDKFVKKIELELGKNKGYVFIDEIQRKENAGLFLKGLYDMNLPYKFILSGSGSVELKEKVHESLAGRKRTFELPTLSFKELVNFRTGYKYEHNLKEFFEIDSIRSSRLLEEYLNFGGYPRVALAETSGEKQKIIDEIYHSYLEKDIFYLLGVEKEEAFTNLVRLLSRQIGNLVNISELSSTLGISAKTAQNYLWYLQKTFILHKIGPYFKNARKEITKAPVFYFSDLGLRSYAAGEWGNAVNSRDIGFIFENLVMLLLRENIFAAARALRFWRSKDGAEVDFVIDTAQEIIPIEVKYKSMKGIEIGKSLRSFIEKYRPPRAYVINIDFKSELKLNSTVVNFLPFYALLDADLK